MEIFVVCFWFQEKYCQSQFNHQNPHGACATWKKMKIKWKKCDMGQPYAPPLVSVRV